MYDFFICHASEDKDSFARPLAARLKKEGFNIWFDEFTIKIGDRLRKNIDKGLTNSKYGIVILSHDFFKKDWPQTELDGLFSLEINNEKKILPIWHQVERDDILKFSPILADRYAVKTKDGLDEIIKRLKELFPSNLSNEENKYSKNNNISNITLPNIPRVIDKAELDNILVVCYENTKQYFNNACTHLEQKTDYIKTQCHQIDFNKFICAINYKHSSQNIVKCKIWIDNFSSEEKVLAYADQQVDLTKDSKLNEFLYPEFNGFNFKFKTSGMQMKNDYYLLEEVPKYLWEIFISKIEYKENY